MTISGFKSLKWADPFLYAATDPRGLFRHISLKENRSICLSFIVPAAVALTEILAFSILGRETGFFHYKITYGLILAFLFIVFKTVVSAALMDSIGQFLGCSGRISETLCILNYSLLPKCLLLPLVYIFKTVNFAPLFFYAFFTMALFARSAYTAIQGLSEMHTIHFSRALLIYLSPGILFAVFILFISFLAVICGIGFIAG